MLPQIKLTVTQNDNLIQTINKTVEKQHLIKSLEEFQLEANAALTKMIEEELGEIGETIGGANMDEDEDDEDTDDDGESSQSTGEKSNGHSESKKKKHT